ncbi:MAG TPA: VTT domain-containing protein [Terriglobia bacterium]|nr:VTT domain-containing protein [Terriglobia bacterium]
MMKILNNLLTFIPRSPPRRTTYASVLRHLGAFGLFFIAILDSSPLPTFGGPDILIAILAGRRGEPWYYYAAAATLGSVIGAYLTFRIARGAGSTYLENKFGARRVATILKFFERWGTGALLLSTLVPFPFPTSAFFAAAGVLNYPLRKFLMVVALGRSTRYFAIAVIASIYGRRFIRVFSHPLQYLGWLLLIACIVLVLTAAALFVRRQLEVVQN